MAFNKRTLQKCPVCGAPALEIIETRHTQLSTRRRKRCNACGHKCTMHEVSEVVFLEAQKALRLMKMLKEELGDGTEAKEGCFGCKHNRGSSCGLDLPEYGTRDAEDCVYYSGS